MKQGLLWISLFLAGASPAGAALKQCAGKGKPGVEQINNAETAFEQQYNSSQRLLQDLGPKCASDSANKGDYAKQILASMQALQAKATGLIQQANPIANDIAALDDGEKSPCVKEIRADLQEVRNLFKSLGDRAKAYLEGACK